MGFIGILISNLYIIECPKFCVETRDFVLKLTVLYFIEMSSK